MSFSDVTADLKLAIFQNFKTDWKLPKHQNDDKEAQNSSEGVSQKQTEWKSDNNIEFDMSMPNLYAVDNSGGKPKGPSVLKRIATWWNGVSGEEPDKVLKAAHRNLQSLEDTLSPDMQAKLAEFDAQVERAVGMHQSGLVERLQAIRWRAVLELALCQGGFKKFLSEAQAVELIKYCKPGLTLTWLSDFGRAIPVETCEKKTAADKLRVFDNYAVMHYDPKDEHHTPPKDPILFGVFKQSRRLYYVADWVDDVCKFTLADAERLLAKPQMSDPSTVREIPTGLSSDR